jgi:hypothetical protein
MKTLAVLAVAVLVSAAAACGGDDSVTTDTAAPVTPAPTEAPVTEPPATEPPATQPPATQPPATQPPATQPPATEAPTTSVPATEPPATEPPSTDTPMTIPEIESPHGSIGDSGAFQITSTVIGGQPEGGVRSYLVEVGMTVEITVVSDTPDEVHLHGYDIEGDLEPGVPFIMTFTASQTGSFEVELHDSGALLLYLDVT